MTAGQAMWLFSALLVRTLRGMSRSCWSWVLMALVVLLRGSLRLVVRNWLALLPSVAPAGVCGSMSLGRLPGPGFWTRQCSEAYGSVTMRTHLCVGGGA